MAEEDVGGNSFEELSNCGKIIYLTLQVATTSVAGIVHKRSNYAGIE